MFLHGGPGAGCAPAHRRLFDPHRYRVILMDQRGCGRSEPFASINQNTTQDLIGDIEGLRQHLDIPNFILFGGSWGSTLALAYGAAYPDRCLGFVLRGVFLGTRAEIDWFLYDMGRFFPEAYDRFIRPIPPSERDNLLAAYYQRLTSPSKTIANVRPRAAGPPMKIHVPRLLLSLVMRVTAPSAWRYLKRIISPMTVFFPKIISWIILTG